MTKGKRILTAVVCLAVLAGGGTGGILFYRSKQAEKHKVDVIPVSNLMDYYWGDEISMDGTVISGDVQNVVLSSDQLIEKVLVKEGDTVTVGTPLLEYDMTAVALDAAQKKTSLAVAEDNVRQAKKELERIKKLKPSEAAPSVPIYPEVPDDPGNWEEPDAPANTLSEVSALTQAAAGTGTQTDPYQFACTGQTVVKQAVLEQIMNAKSCAVFVVYDESGMSLYAWLVRGDTLFGMTLADWTLGEQVNVTEDGGVQIRGGGTWYGTIQVGGTFTYDPAAKPEAPTQPDTTAPTEPSETTPENTETTLPETEPETTPVAEPTAAIRPMASVALLASNGDSEDYMYSRAQLKQKIAEQEIEIQSLEIAQKKAQIEYDSAAEKEESAQEFSKINGVVTKVAESVEFLEQNEPYLVVQGSGGVMVQGSVSEMNLDKLTVGSLISVTSWDTGEMVTAEVMEIDTTPVSYNSQNYGENPNNSMYPFRASVTDATTLSVGSYVSLSFTGEADSDHFYLPVSYVRQENGQYYVMRESKDHKLEKQFIQTGKIIYGGYSIEILSGLSETDKICFPYGKYVTEGASVQETSGSAAYY
ncbi:hypothetical protein [uncultured Ruminococcus sp.]|uniref:hypothetical protein n=1 Tax=uncultured Ruminococcus sp. TaxID=165186 RepID=UPI00261D1C2D|nr:hypothetical protein [uncultured Ruminococcus sp.]